MTARLGPQMELVTKQFSNRIPSEAMRSMLGVLLRFDPYALIAWYPWSSVKMNMILGLFANVKFVRINVNRRVYNFICAVRD
jgi:hypothetical protein